MYKGISIFEYSSGITLNVINNNFSLVNKGITLNTAPFTTIEQNSFSINSPNGSDDSYGIFSYYSEGCDINNNTFATSASNSSETRGIVLVNSNGVSGDQTLLNANTFNSSGTGSFKSAIELEGDNRNCQLQCNVFEADNAADWRFVSNGTGTGTKPTLLDAQGTDPHLQMRMKKIPNWHFLVPGIEMLVVLEMAMIFLLIIMETPLMIK